MEVPFLAEDPPPYGEVEQVSPLVRRIVAPNPSQFTYHGTGTFIVGPPSGGKVAIIDPGPADDAHVGALLRAVEGQTVTHLLITHTPPDHSPATTSVSTTATSGTKSRSPPPSPSLDSGSSPAAMARLTRSLWARMAAAGCGPNP